MTSPLRWLGVLTLLAGSLAVPVAGQSVAPSRLSIDVSKLGPQVGQQVPDFSLQDQTGATRTLRSIMGPRGAVLVFIRSADW